MTLLAAWKSPIFFFFFMNINLQLKIKKAKTFIDSPLWFSQKYIISDIFPENFIKIPQIFRKYEDFLRQY